MIRRTDPHSRRAPRLAPTIEGLEGRLALSAAAAATAPAVVAPVQVPDFPLRTARFAAQFQGAYLQGPARQPGFAIQGHMKGGGNTSAFRHANVQVLIYQPADPSQPAIGQINVIQKGQGTAGNALLLDVTAVPGHVDRGGRPDLFSFEINPGSNIQYTIAEGSGTVRLFYLPSRTPPRGATSGGRLGLAILGQTAVNGISSNVFF